MKVFWRNDERISERGFTLLEVLIALSIIALTLVSLLKVHARNLDMATLSRDITIGSIIAREKIELVHLGDKAAREDREGETDNRYPGFYWDVEKKETPIPGIKELTVEVYKKFRKNEKTEIVRISTYILI